MAKYRINEDDMHHLGIISKDGSYKYPAVYDEILLCNRTQGLSTLHMFPLQIARSMMVKGVRWASFSMTVALMFQYGIGWNT